VNNPQDLRVLVLASTAKDFELLKEILARHGIEGKSCSGLGAVCTELNLGAGLLLIAEEALSQNQSLIDWLDQQPAWSDFPILVLARPGADSAETAAATSLLGNVTILERPMRVATMISAIQSALRARVRQYQIRSHLAARAEAEATLKANDQRKDEFLAILAHELRNPLAPIFSGLQILNLTASDDPETVTMGQMIERQLANLARLVDDLLEVSRVTRGELELRLERAELSSIVGAAIEISRPLIASCNHKLDVALPPQPVYLQADVVRLSQVVSNLLNNAAKYTPAGGSIHLAVEYTDQQVVFSVADDGMGIPPALQPKVFDMFMRGHRSRSHTPGGLGIGLTLVKRLVEMHGGTVEVFSEGADKGAIFTVRLPVHDIADDTVQSNPARAIENLAGLNVLIADDNRDAANSLGILLRKLGASVRITYGGVEALGALDLSNINAAILDLGMDDIDGLEVARRIRTKSGGTRILLVALTGWGQQKDMLDTKNAGFDHHLTKPVDLGQLLGLLASSNLSMATI
jgi:signal transduction histidine kinase/CheY-like chemotaxis protein